MANKTWNLTADARMELQENCYSDYYKLYGSGSLRNCSSFIKSRKDYTEIHFFGDFDTIEDSCFSSNTIKYVKLNSYIFKHLGNRCFRSKMLQNITLPESLESIGHDNFCGEFTSFNIPSKITDFPADNLKDCDKLTFVTVSDGNTAYKAIDGVLYNYDLTEIIFCPNAKIGNIIIPDTVKRIGEYCFYGCKSLKMISIPSSVEFIGNYAFSEISIEKLTIPNSVKSLGEGVFRFAQISSCLKLSSQIYEIPKEAFRSCHIGNLKYNFHNVTSFGESAFESIKEQTLPLVSSFYSLKELGKNALASCGNLECIELYSTLEKIGESAFRRTSENFRLRFFSYCPIRININAFEGIGENATLVVPKGTAFIYQNIAPWSAIPNIEEWDIHVDKNEDGDEVLVSDEVFAKRLRSIADSKNNADRYYLKEIITELSMSYLDVGRDDEYDEALSLISYNRSFSPAIVPELEQKICQQWSNKYKLKLLSKVVIESPATPFVISDSYMPQELPVADTLALPLTSVSVSSDNRVVSSGDVKVYFDNDILREIQNRLCLVKESLKIAVSWFTNFSLFKQVKEIAESGVKVQLITNNDLTNNGGYCLNLNELINAGVELSLVEYPHLLHHKFCIIDDGVVINGSYNWTRFSAKNYENITVIEDNDDVIAGFNNEFDRLLVNAEYKCIDKMPEFVPERPEYDRSAFRQYVTEELDAEARETSNERDKITALQKAAKLNTSYLDKINPDAKTKYAQAFEAMDQSVAIAKTIVEIVDDKLVQTKDAITSESTVKSSTDNIDSQSQSVAIKEACPIHQAIVTREQEAIVEKVKASNLFMVLDISGSMQSIFRAGHVHAITKKALSAALAISESQEVSVWTFSKDARLVGNIGIDNISDIDKISCDRYGTYLEKFVEKADPSINENSLVIIFTDDDSASIQKAVFGMKKRPNVFWQIIVYGTSYSNISSSISGVENTSVVGLTDYKIKTDVQISKILLKDYLNWKKNRS